MKDRQTSSVLSQNKESIRKQDAVNQGPPDLVTTGELWFINILTGVGRVILVGSLQDSMIP